MKESNDAKLKAQDPKPREVNNIPQYCPVNYSIPDLQHPNYTLHQTNAEPLNQQQIQRHQHPQQQLPAPPVYPALSPPPREQPKTEDVTKVQPINNTVPHANHIFPIMGAPPLNQKSRSRKESTIEGYITLGSEAHTSERGGPTYQSPLTRAISA